MLRHLVSKSVNLQRKYGIKIITLSEKLNIKICQQIAQLHGKLTAIVDLESPAARYQR